MKTILYLKTDITYKELIAGGSVTHTLGVINGFKQLGHRIICASSSMLALLKQQELERLVILQNPSQLAWLKWRINCLLSNVFFFNQIKHVLHEYQFDAIYQRYSPFNIVGVMLAKRAKVPLILEYNGSEVWVDKHWTNKRKLPFATFSWLLLKCEMMNLKRADHIVVVSQALQEELVERGIDAQKIIVNPNGVDTNQLDPAQLADVRAQTRQQLNVHDKIVIGFVGTFSAWHGVDTLAAMIPKILAQHDNVHFLLIGDGPELCMLKRALQEQQIDENRVTMTGLLAPTTTHNYLAACDIFLSPTKPNQDGTRFFGSPTKLFEYMSLGKPIIASDLEQLSQVIQPAIKVFNDYEQPFEVVDQVGMIVRPDNVQGFIAATKALIDCDVASRERMGAMARAKAVREYTWCGHVERIVERINRPPYQTNNPK